MKDLFYVNSVMYILHVKALHIEILHKHHDNLLVKHLVTNQIYMQICEKY